MKDLEDPSRPGVVIVGGGFAGLSAAQSLAGHGHRVTLVDRRNYHLFQPLLYQVASGGLSPGDIAYPLRTVLRRYPSARVMLAELVDVDPQRQEVTLQTSEAPPRLLALRYTQLILATGVGHHYFGNDRWAEHAPGLKTVAESLDIRARVLQAFEAAELAATPELRAPWLNFVVIGGGPTGVELSGAIAELAHGTLRGEFRSLDLGEVRVTLLEAAPRVLPPYPEGLSARAQRQLEQLGVTVHVATKVADVDAEGVVLGDGTRVASRTVLWTAGIQPTEIVAAVAGRLGAATDVRGRIQVNDEFCVPGHDDVYVVGDIAAYADARGRALPGIAPVAMQQGKHVAEVIHARGRGRRLLRFRYRDRGMLAVIGRNRAVGKIGRLRLSGWLAWVLWLTIHLRYLIGFNNRLLVFLQWGFNYLTRKRGARLIT
jgi:NADH dehydrogenase